MQALLLVLAPALLVAGEKKSRGTKSLCTLPAQNMSLAPLGENDYYTAENRDDKTMIYLSLCHPLRNLPPAVAALCETNAFSCITKLNVTNQQETEHIRNAGLGSGAPALSKDGGHIQLHFENGEKCKDGRNNLPNYSTFIDFFCGSDNLMGNAIRYEGKLGNCASQVFWHTSLACLPGSLEAAPQAGSCLLRIPGYDTSLDLSSWGSAEGYFEAQSKVKDGKEVDVKMESKAESGGNKANSKRRKFHLNLCNDVSNGVCNNTVACEVDSKGENLVKNLISKNHKRTPKYNELFEMISLTYEDNTSKIVQIDIKCDKSAENPIISLLSNEGTKYKFEWLTRMACLQPPVQCTAEDTDGDIFSLAMLAGIEWEIGVEDTPQKYAIKVCGSLPMNSDNPCRGQAGVCSYNETAGGKKTAPMNLGLMSQKPQVNNVDHSISMLYEKGDTYVDPNNSSNTCRRSAEITLMCNDQENGPRVTELNDPCRHQLIWETPAACPQKKAVSHNCTVREPRWSNLFNLTTLYNSTDDHRININGTDFVFNVCGRVISGCTGANEVCFQHEKDLTYDDGTLMMRHTSTRKCPSNPSVNMTTTMNFLCTHGAKASQPKASLLQDACQLEVEWRTELACPPHQEMQCSLSTPRGIVDLSSLSLPGANYQVQSDGSGEFAINVCRTLVHTAGSHCPYSAAACFTKTVNGSTDSNNLGQVSDGQRPRVDPDGKVFINYKLGSICLDSSDNRNHIETLIYFECDENLTDSEPQFVEQNLCQYIFNWKHAAACPVTQTVAGNCTVTSRTSGFTFNLTSLRKDSDNYHRKGTYHHINYNVDFNVCGPLANSSCPPGSGLCSVDGTDMGQGNADLIIEDEHLSLTYKDGGLCDSTARRMETRINFFCPSRRSLASGNNEGNAPQLVQRNTQCVTTVEFYTDLACHHQVHCEVATDYSLFSLTRLRRHQRNYHVRNKNKAAEDFVLNICGPLVPADVPRSRCNPHGACSSIDSRYKGLGKVQTSPYMGENGHLVIDYKEGGVCGNRGQQWSTKIFFTCDLSESLDAEHPLGRPEHISTSDTDCLVTFKFPTVLACANTTADQIVDPDSCKIYHPGTHRYIDIHRLIGIHPYKILDPESKNKERYFEMQPCGRVASCRGHVCSVHTNTNKSQSLGSLSDFMYEPTLDSVRLRYINGDLCNSRTQKRWASKIYYTCDQNAGVGAPVVRETYDCLIIFDWRTSAFCTERSTIGPIPDVMPGEPAAPHDLPTRAVGGTNWGMVFLCLLLVLTVVGMAVLYKKPEARERVIRVVQETRARMPVVLGGRGRDDSTLLVSNGRFGSLADDDDFS